MKNTWFRSASQITLFKHGRTAEIESLVSAKLQSVFFSEEFKHDGKELQISAKLDKKACWVFIIIDIFMLGTKFVGSQVFLNVLPGSKSHTQSAWEPRRQYGGGKRAAAAAAYSWNHNCSFDVMRKCARCNKANMQHLFMEKLPKKTLVGSHKKWVVVRLSWEPRIKIGGNIQKVWM